MKEITRTFTLFSFNELSTESKENVKNHYLCEDARGTEFVNNLQETLMEYFPLSNVNFNYIYDGWQSIIRMYGSLRIKDILDFKANHKIDDVDYIPLTEFFTDKEIRTLNFYDKYTSGNYEYYTEGRFLFLNHHARCDKCSKYFDSVADTIKGRLEYLRIKNINTEVLEKFEEYFIYTINTLNENLTYLYDDYFTEVSEDVLRKYYSDADFLEDGTLFTF